MAETQLSKHDKCALEMVENANNLSALYVRIKKLVHKKFNEQLDRILHEANKQKILIITTQPGHAYKDKLLEANQYKYKGQMKDKKYDDMMTDPNCIKYFFIKIKTSKEIAGYTYECLGRVTEVVLETRRSDNKNPCYVLNVSTSDIPTLKPLSDQDKFLVSDYHIKLHSLLRYGIYPANNNFSRGICEGYLKTT